MLLTCFGTVFLSPERFLNFAVFICYSSFKYPIAVVNNLIFALHISFFFFLHLETGKLLSGSFRFSIV